MSYIDCTRPRDQPSDHTQINQYSAIFQMLLLDISCHLDRQQRATTMELTGKQETFLETTVLLSV